MKGIFQTVFPFESGDLKKNWSEAWCNPAFRLKAILTALILLTIVCTVPGFFSYIQSRPGFRMNDVVLNFIPAKDVSWFIFSLIYPLVILTLINLIPQPALFLKCLQAYCILMLLRFCTLLLVPLEPQLSLVPLQDPFIGRFFYSNSVVTKDLFFSGHVSTLFLVFLANPVPRLSKLLLASTCLIAGLIIVQHVHYTIDVLAAPAFAWLSFKIAGLHIFAPKEKNVFG